MHTYLARIASYMPLSSGPSLALEIPKAFNTFAVIWNGKVTNSALAASTVSPAVVHWSNTAPAKGFTTSVGSDLTNSGPFSWLASSRGSKVGC